VRVLDLLFCPGTYSFFRKGSRALALFFSDLRNPPFFPSVSLPKRPNGACGCPRLFSNVLRMPGRDNSSTLHADTSFWCARSAVGFPPFRPTFCSNDEQAFASTSLFLCFFDPKRTFSKLSFALTMVFS